MKNKKNYIEINAFLYIFLFLCSIILINDYLTYFINIRYVIGIVLSTIIVVLVHYLLLKKKIVKIIKNKSKYDLVFFILLFLLFLITFVYPDRTFDTINYHLYLQEKPFGNKIFGDFFAAKNINTFTYAFTDRFAYLFRYIFGYRVGIIFNYFTLTTIYYQMKKILKQCIKNSKEFIISLLAILCTFTLSSIELMDSYYVDIISVIFLLELFYLTFFEKYDDKKLYYIGLLSGFAFVSKISNAFIIIILAIAYIILHFKEMKKTKLKKYVLAIIIFCLPFFVYMLYTFISTGNPFFPFYNKIFKSDFYSNKNWMDKRFGPKSFIEVLLWPFLMQIYPSRSYDIGIVEPMWAIGYLVCIINIIKIIVKTLKHMDKITIYDKISIFTFISFIVWSKFMLGYTRYGLSVLYYSIIVTYVFLYNMVKEKKYIISGLLILCLIANYGNQLYNFTKKAESWSFSNIFSNDYKEKNVGYKSNLKKIFKDRDININLGKDSIIGISFSNSGFATMLDKNNDYVSLTSGVSNQYTKELLEKKLENKKIYTLIDSVDIDQLFTSLNKNKYKIIDSYDVFEPDFLDSNNKIYVFEIIKSKKNKNNYNEIVKSYKLETNGQGKYKINFLAGPGKYMRVRNLSDYYIKLSKCNNNECENIKSQKLSNSKIINYDETIDLKDDEKIYIRLTDKDDHDVEYFAAMIINLEIKEIE